MTELKPDSAWIARAGLDPTLVELDFPWRARLRTIGQVIMEALAAAAPCSMCPLQDVQIATIDRSQGEDYKHK